jgi:hypothetical protein
MGVQAERGQVQAGPSRRASNRARAVWLVMALSTVAFVGLCALASTLVYGYLSSVTVQQTATLELRQGTQLTVQRKGLTTQELVTRTALLREGDQVITGPGTEGFVELFDREVTVQTYFSTTLRLDTIRTTRFFQSLRELHLTLAHGTMILATGGTGEFNDESYTVATPDGDVLVGANSKVRVISEGPGTTTNAVVDYGTATLFSGGRKATIGSGQMASSLQEGRTGLHVQSAQQELVQNGDFMEAPTSGAETSLGTAVWLPVVEPSGTLDALNDIRVVSETIGTSNTLFALRIEHKGPADKYARLGVRQDINQPVDYLHKIELSLLVKVVDQPAANKLGGPDNDVYPLTVRVNYTGANGQAKFVKQSFRYADGTQNDKDQQVLQGSWTTKQITIKLNSTTSDEPSVNADMAVINSIEIYGYGPPDIQSWVTNVSMLAQ